MSLTAKQGFWTLLAALALAAGGYWLLAPRDKAVATLTADVAPAQRILAVNGRIRPRLQVDIRPSVGGELVDLPFDVGDRIAAGQIVARIDDGPETAAISEAEASVRAQEASLAQARRDLARFEAIGEFASRRDVEQKRLAVVEGERELARRRAARVRVDELRDRRVLRAPFSGIILERPVDPGQTVGPDSVIYRLADLERPEVTVEVDEVYAAEVRPGMEALISLPGQERASRAKVLHVQPRVNPQTGARDVRLGLVDDALDAPSGLTVTVNLVIERRQSAISLPRSAILPSANGASVRIVRADDVVEERAIGYIDWPAETVIVTSGVKAGERILADPGSAQPGETVRASAGAKR